MKARAAGFAKQVEQLSKTENKPKNDVSVRRFLWAFLPVAIAVLGVIVVWQWKPQSLYDGWGQVWWFLNVPFGSMLLPAAFLGFGGWSLLTGWEILQNRQKLMDTGTQVEFAKRERKEQEVREERRQQHRRTELLERIRRQRELAERQEASMLLARSSDEKIHVTLKKLQAQMKLVADQFEGVIAAINDNDVLGQFSSMSRRDYVPILQRAFDRSLLDSDGYIGLVEVFRLWHGIVSGSEQPSRENEARILEFNPRNSLPTA